jgi:hypothetical protein
VITSLDGVAHELVHGFSPLIAQYIVHVSQVSLSFSKFSFISIMRTPELVEIEVGAHLGKRQVELSLHGVAREDLRWRCLLWSPGRLDFASSILNRDIHLAILFAVGISPVEGLPLSHLLPGVLQQTSLFIVGELRCRVLFILSCLVKHISRTQINELIQNLLFGESWQKVWTSNLGFNLALYRELLVVERITIFRPPPVSFRFILICLALIILFKVENNLLNSIVDHGPPPIGLIYRQCIGGRCILQAHRLSSFLGHIKIGIAHMAFDLLDADQLPIIFEFANDIETFRGLDGLLLLLLLLLLHVLLGGLFEGHVLQWRDHLFPLRRLKDGDTLLHSRDGVPFTTH